MNLRRTTSAAVLTVAVTAVLAGCGAAAPATPPAPAAPAPAAPAADPVATTCDNLLRIDGVPAPESGPDGVAPPEAVTEYGTAVATLLDGALEHAPAPLAGSLTALQPIIAAAATDGVAPDFEDPAYTGAVLGYEQWAHDNCDYQQVALTGTDFHFDGAPTELDAGPVSILLTNESAAGEFHVAHLARAMDDSVTLDRVLASSFEELMQIIELVPGVAAAAPGQTSGFLADLEPGRYFLICPVGDAGQTPHHLQGMITEVTVG